MLRHIHGEPASPDAHIARTWIQLLNKKTRYLNAYKTYSLSFECVYRYSNSARCSTLVLVSGVCVYAAVKQIRRCVCIEWASLHIFVCVFLWLRAHNGNRKISKSWDTQKISESVVCAPRRPTFAIQVYVSTNTEKNIIYYYNFYVDVFFLFFVFYPSSSRLRLCLRVAVFELVRMKKKIAMKWVKDWINYYLSIWTSPPLVTAWIASSFDKRCIFCRIFLPTEMKIWF